MSYPNPADEEHQDVMRLIVAAAQACNPDPIVAGEARLVCAGMIAIVAAKYGALEHRRNG